MGPGLNQMFLPQPEGSAPRIAGVIALLAIAIWRSRARRR